MKQPEPAYSDLSLEQQVDARRRIYHFCAEKPRFFATIRNKFFALSESQVRGAVDALCASGGLTLLEPMSGESQGRYRANEVGR